MQDLPETPDERLLRRRTRRWKRRVRIIAPFLGVPLLLATLSLSVDLIEYRPQQARDRLTDRPIRLTPDTMRRSTSRPVIPDAPLARPLHPAVSDDAHASDARPDEIDVMLPTSTAQRTPPPPAALRVR